MNTKKSQELPINFIVMLILGVIIFSIRIILFSKFYNRADKGICEEEEKIAQELADLECADDTSSLCISFVNVKCRKKLLAQVHITNYKETSKTLKLEWNNVVNCPNGGSAEIKVHNKELKVRSSETIKIPIVIKNLNLKSSQCYAEINLIEEGQIIEKDILLLTRK